MLYQKPAEALFWAICRQEGAGHAFFTNRFLSKHFGVNDVLRKLRQMKAAGFLGGYERRDNGFRVYYTGINKIMDEWGKEFLQLPLSRVKALCKDLPEARRTAVVATAIFLQERKEKAAAGWVRNTAVAEVRRLHGEDVEKQDIPQVLTATTVLRSRPALFEPAGNRVRVNGLVSSRIKLCSSDLKRVVRRRGVYHLGPIRIQDMDKTKASLWCRPGTYVTGPTQEKIAEVLGTDRVTINRFICKNKIARIQPFHLVKVATPGIEEYLDEGYFVDHRFAKPMVVRRLPCLYLEEPKRPWAVGRLRKTGKAHRQKKAKLVELPKKEAKPKPEETPKVEAVQTAKAPQKKRAKRAKRQTLPPSFCARNPSYWPKPELKGNFWEGKEIPYDPELRAELQAELRAMREAQAKRAENKRAVAEELRAEAEELRAREEKARSRRTQKKQPQA